MMRIILLAFMAALTSMPLEAAALTCISSGKEEALAKFSGNHEAVFLARQFLVTKLGAPMTETRSADKPIMVWEANPRLSDRGPQHTKITISIERRAGDLLGIGCNEQIITENDQ